jgi:hypothetical protein
MSLKERLVHAHLLQPHNPFAGYELNDPVDQQKREAMRQKLLDRKRVKNGFHRSNIAGSLVVNKKTWRRGTITASPRQLASAPCSDEAY